MGEGRALACVAALLLGCASAQPHEVLISVRAETPSGEPLEDALNGLDVCAPIGAVVTEGKPPPRIPAHAIRGLPLTSLRAPLPCYVSLVLGEWVFDTKVVSEATDVVFKVEPEAILRAMPTVRVRLVARPEDVAAVGPQLASAAWWDATWEESPTVDVRSGSCEIRHAVPGEGVLFVAGPYALAMMRIDVGTNDIDLELPLVRPAPVSGRVEAPPMTDPSCDVYALPLDGGFSPPPLGSPPFCPAPKDGVRDRPNSSQPAAAQASTHASFTFASGPRGRQVLLVMKKGYGIGWAEVDNTSGPVEGVRIPLRPGVEVTLKTALTGLNAPYVQIETEEGIPLFARLLVFDKHKPATLTLAEGHYVLRHRTANGEWQARPLAVANEPVVVWIQ